MVAAELAERRFGLERLELELERRPVELAAAEVAVGVAVAVVGAAAAGSAEEPDRLEAVVLGAARRKGQRRNSLEGYVVAYSSLLSLLLDRMRLGKKRREVSERSKPSRRDR